MVTAAKKNGGDTLGSKCGNDADFCGAYSKQHNPTRAMRVTRAYVIAMDSERQHTLKAKGLQALETDVRDLFGIPLENWRASTDVDPEVPVVPRAVYGYQHKRQESRLDIATKGAIGCATSHVRLLRSIPNNDEWTLVFESDAVLGSRGPALKDFVEHGEGSRAHADPTVPLPCMIMLRINCAWVERDNREPVPGFHRVMRFIDTFMGTCAYLVRNKDARHIADALVPIELQVDGALGVATTIGKIPPIWLATPPLASAFNSQVTTIQTNFAIKPDLPYKNAELGMVVALPWFLFLACMVAVVVLATRKTIGFPQK
jgi:hypothetical protein